MHALIVEDDRHLAQALARILEGGGHRSDLAYDGPTGLERALGSPFDVIVLDVMLPGMDGLALVSELRRREVSTPVLLLTARDAVSDKIEGLDAGADDYMTKPFAPAELLAHLRALTRRQGEVVFEVLKAGDLALNVESGDLSCGDRSIHLSHKEHLLARVLMANVNRAVPKETIIAKVWGVDSSADDNNVEAYISFLRKKIRFLNSESNIETLRKVGYRLVAGGPDAC